MSVYRPTHYTVEVVVTAQMSLDVVLNVSSQSRLIYTEFRSSIVSRTRVLITTLPVATTRKGTAKRGLSVKRCSAERCRRALVNWGACHPASDGWARW